MTEIAGALCSWSGGKDSCLALHLALDAGLKVTRLLTMFEPDADRSRSHALGEELLRAQAEALALELVLPRAGWESYESVFVAELERARLDGIEQAIFGDIDLVAHREWEEKVCARAGLAAYLPLWEWPRARVVDALFEHAIEAVCVCVNTRYLSREFCGRPYDRAFLRDLPQGVDACGENGEFHTFVTHAPRFRSPIRTRVKDLWQYRGPAEYGGDLFWFADLERA
jgi:uncharacterized protein (TIGR00290 family)